MKNNKDKIYKEVLEKIKKEQPTFKYEFTDNGFEGEGYFIDRYRPPQTEEEKKNNIGRVELLVKKFSIVENELILYSDRFYDKEQIWLDSYCDRITKNFDIEKLRLNDKLESVLCDLHRRRVVMGDLIEIFESRDGWVYQFMFLAKDINQIKFLGVSSSIFEKIMED